MNVQLFADSGVVGSKQGNARVFRVGVGKGLFLLVKKGRQI